MVAPGKHGRSDQYERQVTRVLEAKLRADYPNAAVEVLHRRKYPGQSGHEHEIDVSAVVMIADARVLIVVECKYHQRPLGNDDVLTFLGRIRDIGANKGILVTATGYQEGSKRIAEANGIALMLLRSEDDFSWEVVLPALFAPLLAATAALIRPSHGDRTGETSALSPDKTLQRNGVLRPEWPGADATADEIITLLESAAGTHLTAEERQAAKARLLA